MKASTLSLFLFALAGLSLLSGLEWLFVVFIALGLALFYYERNASPAEMMSPPAAPAKKTQTSPPQIVIIQKGDEGVSRIIAEEIVKHEILGKARPYPDESKRLEGEIKGLKKEIASLKKKDDKKK